MYYFRSVSRCVAIYFSQGVEISKKFRQKSIKSPRQNSTFVYNTCKIPPNCMGRIIESEWGRMMMSPLKYNERVVIIKGVSCWKSKLSLIVAGEQKMEAFFIVARKTWCMKFVNTSSRFHMKKPAFI